MPFCPRWKPPARPRRAPAGSRSTSSPRPTTARSLGVVPCYLKSHSRGEYVFDAGWADAYERAGGSYYPEAPGLGAVHAGDRAGACWSRRATRAERGARRPRGRADRACRLRDASSVHVTFAPQDEWTLLGAHGFLQRNDQQFHWENGGYATLRGFPRGARGAQAQGDPARARAARSSTASRCSGSPAAT